jgi:benzoyl-CoA reductase/2-hydroxyglutaryl-CoA dehydratase subunit BcrC/BadD/HgdB
MRTVIYNSPFVPAEWIAAHGLRPRRLRPDPAAALPSTGPLTGVCPYARAFIGEAAPERGADAAVLTTTCDQMRRAAEWLTLGGGPPVFLMNVPATWQTPAAARMYRDELQRLGRFLVGLGGAAPSRERLAETMESYDARRAALRGALGELSARQASEAVARYDLGENVAAAAETLRGGSPCAFGVAPDSQSRVPQLAGQAVRHIEQHGLASNPWHPTSATPNTCGSPEPPRGTPVALVGGPLMRGDERVFDIIEQSGGRVVLDGTESGLRTLPAPLQRRRLRDDPLLELMDAYFGAIPDAFRRPDTALYQWLGRELAAGAARGVIVWRYVWCDLWAASAARLREATGLPVLDLDVSGDDSAPARTAGRIQAFMEVLR